MVTRVKKTIFNQENVIKGQRPIWPLWLSTVVKPDID